MHWWMIPAALMLLNFGAAIDYGDTKAIAGAIFASLAIWCIYFIILACGGLVQFV